MTLQELLSGVFVTDYEVHDTASGFGYSSDYSVEAALNTDNSRDDIIAPGTSGKMNFSITGTPEVAVNVKVDFNTTPNSLKMVTIPVGEYTDYTEATYATKADGTVDKETTYNKTFEVKDKAYNPVVWTLKRSDTDISDFTSATTVATGNLEAIQNYFTTGAAKLNKNYDPGTELDKTFGYYELSWSWPYEGVNDHADTYLGNVIAGVKTDDTVKTTEAFDLSIVVTQID